MSGSIHETEGASRSRSAQEATIDEIEDAMQRLRISPRKVLASLSNLRIDNARIKPIEGQVPKAGGKADVEAAMLASAPSESDDAEYVAIKKLRLDEDTDDDRALAPLAHEVDLLNNLSHEGVVKVMGFVEEVEKGVAWMVFAWEKNGNLREFIRSAKWELPERISLIDDVARGLSYLHERNPPICHGDLKSLNILVNSENRAMITDFGSARAVGLVDEQAVKGVRATKVTSPSSPAATEAQNTEALSAEVAPSGEFITMTGPAWTVRWAAPELLEGNPPGLASDIWAWGWICWEAVTGNFPFDKENDTAVVLRITKGDLPTIENDDQLKQIKALCSLMRGCWTLDIRERPTALRCQQVVGFMDQTVPSPREGNGSTVTRSSGLLYALGCVQLQNDMYAEAREYFEQSLAAAGSVGDQSGEARAYKAFGEVSYMQNEYFKAEESFIQARDIYSQIGNELGIARSVRRLGNVYYMRAEYSKAEEACIQARTIYSKIEDQHGLAQSIDSLGDVYCMRAEYSKAEESFIQAREIYSQMGNQLGFAQSTKSLGDVYKMRAEYSKAEESYIQAREVYSQIGSQLGVAQSTRSLGDVYHMRAEHFKAEELYIQAREVDSQIGNQLGVAHCTKSLGDVYHTRAEYSKAEECCIQARDIYSQIGDQLGFAQSIKRLASRSTSAQEATVDQIEDAMQRLRISPRKVLASLSHLRIDRARIKPIEGQVPKAGGKADVEAAMLASPPFATPSESDDPDYVAIKKLRLGEDTDDNRALAPLAHEVNLLNNLSHRNVVKVIGFVEEVKEGVAWMVFAWEKNGNLREFICSTKWELPERLSLIDDVARGLSYLHERNPPICHGDLKSLNILVNFENRAMITDFGSARAMGLVEEETGKAVRATKATSTPSPAATEAHNTEALSAEVAPSGEFITMTGPAWTVRWAAPELLEGYLPGLASDIWAFGWICWEAVTGNFPFEKENDTAVVLRITKGDLPTIENDDQLKQIKALCSLMRGCWTLDIRERPTALRCQQVVGFMDQTVPSPREGIGSPVTRSSGLLYALGWVKLRNDMYAEAREYFEQSLAAAESVGDESGEARAYQAFGEVSYMQNEYFKAEESFIQARDIDSQIGNELGIARSVKRLGNVYYMRAEYSKAEEACIQARTIYSKIEDQHGLAQSIDSLGDVYCMRAEYSKAEESFIQAREIYSQMGNQLGFAQSTKSLGDVYKMRAEYSKAEESYIQAWEIYSQIGSQLGFAQSTKSLGDVYHMRAEYSKAEEWYIQSREIYSQIGSQLGFAQSTKSLGDVYYMREEYSKAEESYIQSREIYSQIGSQLGFAQSTKSLGDVYRRRDEYSSAEEAYIQARDVSSEMGNQVNLAYSLEGIGRLHSARREYTKAEESYSEAQQIYRRIGDRRSLADISWYLGWLHREQAQYGEADRLVREASAIYDGLGLTQDVKQCDEFLEEIRELM